MKKTIDELLQTPYWIIDILPKQVPENTPGQFFEVEKYYLEKERLREIKQKHINVVLKLNCYRSVSIDEETEKGSLSGGRRKKSEVQQYYESCFPAPAQPVRRGGRTRWP